MNLKRKGTNAERELVHLFWKVGWAAIRVAGSGSIKYPAPDLIAGNGIRRVVVECKSPGGDSVYLTTKEVLELKQFGDKIGAECWIGVRFNAKWVFLGMEELEPTPTAYVVSVKKAQLRGVSFEELTT